MAIRKNVLFVHYGDNWIRGSERCLIDHLLNLDRSRFLPFLWTNNAMLHEEISKMGIHSVLSPFPILLGWKAPRFQLFGWWNLVNTAKTLIKDCKIDLIHANSAGPCQWIGKAANETGTPWLAQLHSDYPARDRLTLALHRVPNIIAVSYAIIDKLMSDGYPAERIHVIHNGIDTERLELLPAMDLRQRLQLDDDAFLFISVGSLIKRKGMDRLLQAMRFFVLEHPNAHLIIVGDGPERKSLEQMSDYLKLSQHIHFVGEQHNVMGWLKGANAFISGARREPFGLVIAEAALAELPIIAPDTGGIPEILRHQTHGQLYPKESTKAMHEAMRWMMKNPIDAKMMAVKAHAHILLAHTLEKNRTAIEALYEQILSSPATYKDSFWATWRPVKTYVSQRFSLGG
ncbi:glycosyltransferase [Vibrio sp. 1151_11]|uniref:glycosyltransferase n=1 Tax=Vibrio sp. 1151_11 TaxID=2527670 RepID=UPI00240573E7|nr:glycosyltransferase [Vibrio sp. 1151_11]MDF9387843.1 glycosyltransferase [Vibrio sp. 1151_11]